jgi:hypothetical protein
MMTSCDVTFCDCFAPVPFVLLERVQMSNFYLCVSSEARQNVPSGERNVAYGYSETKGLLPLVQNRLSFATRT